MNIDLRKIRKSIIFGIAFSYYQGKRTLILTREFWDTCILVGPSEFLKTYMYLHLKVILVYGYEY